MANYFYLDSKIHQKSEPLPKVEIPNEPVVINWMIFESDLINSPSYHVPRLMDISGRKGNVTRNHVLYFLNLVKIRMTS